MASYPSLTATHWLPNKWTLLIEMVNEFECELLQAGYRKSDSTGDEVEPLKEAHDWHLLFPEAVQDVDIAGSSTTKHQICHQEDAHQGHGRSRDCDSSFEAVVEVSSLMSTSSSSSHSESEDVNPTDRGLGKPASNSGVPSGSDIVTNLASTSERSSFAKPEGSSEITCESPLITAPSPMHNPPAQVMERDKVYDPQRIPSSVFARSDSLSPAEWSSGSNESLFSLQVGNTSISREQALIMSGELERLTQLSKTGELSPAELKELRKLAGLTKSSEILMMSPPPPVISEVENEGEVEEARNLEVLQKEPTIDIKEEQLVLEKKEEERHQHRLSSPRSSNLSHPSDVSEESTYSFAFPILGTGEKSAVVSKDSHQWQSEPPWEPKSAVVPVSVLSEPVTPRKRRCFDCFCCRRCFSCNWCSFSCCRCSSWSHFFSCCSCFSCSRCFSCSFSCSCCSCRSCCCCLKCC